MKNTVANALLTAKEVLTQMLSNGTSDDKAFFALSSALIERYNLTRDESIIIIEEALKIA